MVSEVCSCSVDWWLHECYKNRHECRPMSPTGRTSLLTTFIPLTFLLLSSWYIKVASTSPTSSSTISSVCLVCRVWCFHNYQVSFGSTLHEVVQLCTNMSSTQIWRDHPIFSLPSTVSTMHHHQQHQQQRTKRSPDNTSSSLMSILPSLRSTYKSWILQLTRTRCELTHLANVFFCTLSLSSYTHKYSWPTTTKIRLKWISIAMSQTHNEQRYLPQTLKTRNTL